MARRKIGYRGGAILFGALWAGAVAAQPGRYGAVPDVPLNPAAQSWGDRGWETPESGAARPPVVDRRVPSPDRLRDDRRPAAYGGHYVRPERGGILPGYFAAPAFTVRDFANWGLAAPGPGRRWVRYYDDAVLVGPGGRIVAVRPAIDWSRDDDRRGGRDRDPAYEAGYADGYADGRDDAADWTEDAVTYGGDRAVPGSVVTRTTPGTITTKTTVIEEIVPAPRVPVRRKSRARR